MSNQALARILSRCIAQRQNHHESALSRIVEATEPFIHGPQVTAKEVDTLTLALDDVRLAVDTALKTTLPNEDDALASWSRMPHPDPTLNTAIWALSRVNARVPGLDLLGQWAHPDLLYEQAVIRRLPNRQFSVQVCDALSGRPNINDLPSEWYWAHLANGQPGHIFLQGQEIPSSLIVPAQIHDAFARHLQNVCAALEEHGIEHWITGGTLLGVERHDGHFIPWDDDVDLCVVPRRGESMIDLDRALRKAFNFPTRLEAAPLFGYKVYADHDVAGEDVQELRKYFAFGVFVDLFVMERTEEGSIQQHLQSARSTWPNENWSPEQVKSELFPLREVTFEGLKVKAPQNPTAYLDRMYSRPSWRDTWVIPRSAHGRTLPFELHFERR